MRTLLTGFGIVLGGVLAGGSGVAADLQVLTYNVRGLPGWLAGDKPEVRLPEIARRLDPFDIVLLQEDFAFPDVFARLEGWSRLRGQEAGGWSAVYGAGLTVLSRLPAVDAPKRRTYDTCAGWLGGAMDCFATKGTVMVRVAADDGTELDVYTTHLDAGQGDDDQAARQAQLATLTQAVGDWSAGRAVLLGGDFNLNWQARSQREALTAFAAGLGLRRVPVEVPGRAIDHVLVRDGQTVRVAVIGAGYAPGFVQSDGQPLSDHPPLSVQVRTSRR